MSTTPSTTTVAEVSKILAPVTPAITPNVKPETIVTAPAAAASANTAPATVVPLVAATAATGCCHGTSAGEKTVAVHAAPSSGATGASTQAASGHSCHGTGDALKSLVNDLESPDAARRLTAANALGQLKNHAAAAPLIAALADSDADVAHAAAAGLGILGDRSAVEPLIAVVNNADGYFHDIVRTAGTISLGQLRDLRAVEPLQNAIKDPMADTSAQAIRALAALGDPRGVAPLLEVVRNADGFFLQMARHAAILGLARLGGTQADCELRFVASNQFEDAAIRDAATGAIGGTPAPVGAN